MQSLEEIRAHRPRAVVTARLLSIIAAVLWIPVAGYASPGGPGNAAPVLALLFYVFGAFGAAKGRQGGRLMATIALGFAYLFLAPYCVVGFFDALYGPEYAGLDIVSVALSAVGLTLMFRPPSNRYVREVTVARRSG